MRGNYSHAPFASSALLDFPPFRALPFLNAYFQHVSSAFKQQTNNTEPILLSFLRARISASKVKMNQSLSK
jgi:hypothetical protein